MIKTLARQIKEYKRASLVTPIFMILEVAMEMVIPLLMASIIDDGVQAGDMKHIFVIGCYMVLAAIVGLFAGVMGGKYGAKASTGFARNLREAMYENIQTFSFSNIDKFSTAGLVTRMTTDVTNIQNAYQMLLRMCFRAPVSLICAMLMGSRDIPGAIRWVREQAASGVDVSTVVEKGKSAFIGPELYKKTLGIIGLGAIGSIVANTAISLGMDVYGYDPFLSVDTALRLDRHVHVVKDINDLYKRSDYITMHIHYTEKTARMIDASAIAAMKRGVRVINLARGEIVDDEAMLTALDTGMVAAYITDFPNNRLLTAPHVIAMPHLGASTPESEQNCAAMAVDTLRDYLESGNIRSSVNLPEMTMDRSGVQRLCVLHKNVPGMLANITSLFGRDGVNVENLSNKSRGDYAYTMVDLGSKVGDNVIEDVRRTANVIRVRSLEW